MINKFRGNYRWLSNMFETPVILHGVKYISVEHAYQSAKSIDEEWKKTCASDQYSSGEIKKLSKSVKIRHDWSEIKNKIMWYLLKQKFSKDPIKSWLLETGNEEIVEGNSWHCNYWGNCTCDKCSDIKGRNLLGKMIMRIRDDLRKENNHV